ncbi:restriction system protein [Propionibacteriaceae bacterium ES.041]|uniref:Restriction endonuclease n=1 Tax=Enemella evansiae TaxID=2016499 RepID=A0A255GPW3_9ACTN|nr:restriction endonuclease [Enemella evansiae]OYO16423.1 restriction endonuclease [Enemella evansiae]PFG65256.1 restriction system protein [Propionibacteriaceae bacterium ES.041]TDO91839.1 restriction system protein [Enemella evansiae]
MTSIPTWDQFMAPCLRVLLDGQTKRARDINLAAADELGVTEAQRQELIPSGQARYLNRALWALSYLYRAGAVDRPNRGYYSITEVGRGLLASHPGGFTERDLRDLEGYVPPNVASTSASTLTSPDSESLASALSPQEQIEDGVTKLHADVAAELLTRLHKSPPEFFEQAVVDLIVAMGYGGTGGAARRTQLTNDGGIDGVVDQDALGLSRVYIQAKRYSPDVSINRPDIQAFVGALHGQQANQGVFITTARFSSGAQAFADAVQSRVVLIDGARLAELMIRYGVGVQVKRTIRLVEIDEDFFEQAL